MNLLVPLIGVAAIGAGHAPRNPGWLSFVGIVLLVLAPLFVFSAVRMWRRCVLRIAASSLTVRLAGPKDVLTEIRRESVLSIEPKLAPSGQSMQVEIAYRTVDLSSNTTKTVQLGLQLSVQPINLLNALVAWNDGASANPSELLDRIDRTLRGRSTADV